MTVNRPTSGTVVCFGEILLRLAAPPGELLLQTPQLQASVGGAEANVAVALTHLGHQVRLVSTLPDQPLGRHARDVLRGHGVETGSVSFLSGRMGLYFLTPGAAARAAEVIYDRAGSAFALRPPATYDWGALLSGAGWLHVSGVTAAVSAHAGQAALEAMKVARRVGVKVSFDGNYRAKLWAARTESPASILTDLVAHADVAFIDRRDIALLLDNPAIANATAQTAAAAAFDAFPQLATIAATTRIQHGADCHELSAALFARSGVAEAPQRRLSGIVDRVGSGDAFAAGTLHGLLSNWEHGESIRFGLGAACAKHGVAGDLLALSEAQIRAAMQEATDVCR